MTKQEMNDMSIKEKAEEIINHYNPFVGYKYNAAKQCAFCHVEGIINELQKVEAYWKNDVIDPVNYWKQVLNKLETSFK